MSDRVVDVEVAVLRRLGEAFGVQTWPIVLDIEDVLDPSAADVGADVRELDQRIVASGFIEDGEPTAWAATALRVLAQAERLIEIRTYSPEGIGRACLARHGHDHVLAIRTGTSISVRVTDIRDAAGLASILVAQLPGQQPARVNSLSHPAQDLVDRIGRCRDDREVTDALHAIGADPIDAMALSAALTSSRTRTEIVAVAAEAGVVTQASGAVAVFDTDRGRIVSSPSRSPDGQVWITLSPGSGHRIGQAIGLMIETLPDGRWFA